ncbi:hypothetical protein IV203_017983 [Nitzschia inconspicua]|uniref:Uncharacterized protein n=1 Tax=Nitzschia inconspicua TaxID=303405 RepID=A0A9K3M2K3_9STRA|nr:hypothetical protein IV203_017983 [Nitzschia inconspicua]
MSGNNKVSDDRGEMNVKPALAPIAPAPPRETATEKRPGSEIKPPPPSSKLAQPATTKNDDKTSGQKRPPPSSPGTPSNKKRPYRRTKRPPGYNDRSTVTTITKKDPEKATFIDAYDAVIAECEDLLNASLEAQQLGRLKMASAYQLLLHTRLVGLGKQFDRNAMRHANNIPVVPRISNDATPKGNPESSADAPVEAEGTNDYDTQKKPAAKSLLQSATVSNLQHENSKPPPKDTPPEQEESILLKKLSSILPQDAIMDSIMMEHLARAAAELHHQRTGRKKSSEGLLASPMTTLESLVKQNLATPDQSTAKPKTPTKSSEEAAVDTSKWTNAEMDIVDKATLKKWEPSTIAKILSNKNEAQIEEYLKQRDEGKFVGRQANGAHALSAARNSNLPTRSVPNEAGGGAAASSSTKAAADKITQSVSSSSGLSPSNDAPHTYFDAAGTANPFTVSSDGHEDPSPNSKLRRGGRGKKPPTTAMNTMPTISLDVRSLLKGPIGLKKGEQ